MLLATKAYAVAFEGEQLELAVDFGQRALARALPAEDAPSWTSSCIVLGPAD